MDNSELIKAGMNVDEFLSRVMNNTALVSILIRKFLDDKNYDGLLSAVETGNMKAAEIYCHTLKGMCGNMALTELFEMFQKQLALFRAGECEAAVALMPMISEKFEIATAHLSNFVSEG